MHQLSAVFHFLLTIDQQIASLIQQYGDGAYFILFAILFAETGFVVTPFLPGDTLLFAAGLFSRPEKHALNLAFLLPLLIAGPLLGDTLNFHLGKWIGPRLFKNDKSKIFNKSHLDQTHAFFEKYGQKTIIIARWVPIVRTFAPFVAGMSQIPYRAFIGFSFIGAVIWVMVCTFAGYFFGSIPIVQKHFSVAMLAMILVTFIPVFLEFLKHRKEAINNKNAMAVESSEASAS